MILVASHVSYQKAWGALKHSLLEAQIDMSNVILVIAGAPNECCEMRKGMETIITVPYNFYEMSAVYGLHRFIDHPRLRAANYLLLHDTCVVTKDFKEKHGVFLQDMTEKGLDVYHAVKDMRVNVLGLSYDFIKMHGQNYGINGDKPAAWHAEHGGALSFRSFVPPQRVSSCGDMLSFGPGQDIYGSKLIRHPINIKCIGVIKFVANDDKDVNPPWQDRSFP